MRTPCAPSRPSAPRPLPRGQREALAGRATSSSDPAGLPHREWFRHLLYAPGFYTGYGVKTMPGPREAIEQGQFTEADAEIARVARALVREATWLDGATALLM